MIHPALVLTTVNASHSRKLDVEELVHCLLEPSAARAMPGHMSSFFGEVKPDLQADFASMFNLTEAQLSAAATAFAMYSGESYPMAK